MNDAHHSDFQSDLCVCVSSPQAASSPVPLTSPFWAAEQEEEEQSHGGNDDMDDDNDDAASLQSIALANDSREGDDGEHYNVVPQPIVAPRMIKPG